MNLPGTIVILITPEAEIRKIIVLQGQPRQNVHQTPSQPMAGHSGPVPIIPDAQGTTNRRIVVWAGLGIK
jgi:hypothetical protein